MGFIMGIRNTLRYYELKHQPSEACIRDSVPNGQVEKVVMKFLNDNPKDLDRPAFLLVLRALRQDFPCLQ